MRHAKMFLYSLFFIGGLAVWNVGLCVDTIQVVFNFLTRNHKGQDPYYTTKDCLRYTGPYTEERIIGDETTYYPPSKSEYWLYKRVRVAPGIWLDSKCAFYPQFVERNCNIRTKPSTKGKIVGKAKSGDRFAVAWDTDGDNWETVLLDGKTYYIWDKCFI